MFIYQGNRPSDTSAGPDSDSTINKVMLMSHYISMPEFSPVATESFTHNDKSASLALIADL